MSGRIGNNYLQNRDDHDVPFSKEKPQRKDYNQNKYRPDSSIDSQVLNTLDQIFKRHEISALKEEDQKEGEISGNQEALIDELVDFIENKKYANQVIQLWSYYSNVNEHGKHTDASLKLSKLFYYCNKFERLQDAGLALIKDKLITPPNVKVFYRDLSSMRPPTTNPALRLLSEAIAFKKGELIDEFLQIFDMNLPVLPKLLVPTRTELSAGARLNRRSIRYNFVRFYNTLIGLSSIVTRKDLLSLSGANARKLNTNLFKYCAKFDTIDSIERAINIWDTKIISEPFFNKFKSIKLKYFNQWNIIALLPLYYLSESSINEKIHSLLTKFFIGEKVGIYIHDNKTWFNEPVHSSLSVDSGNNGQAIAVAGKKFNILNKAIYNIITELKPWDNKLQLELVIKILEKLPELVPLYTTYLASINNNFDPKLSFYWIGQALLLQKIISLPVPEAVANYQNEALSGSISEIYPVTGLAMESILPSCLNSVSLTKCLKSDSFLVKHLALQLLAFSFDKLATVLSVYQTKQWTEESIKVMTRFQNDVPDITILTSLFHDLEKLKAESSANEYKLLIVTLIKVLNNYLTYFTNITLPAGSLASLNNYFNKLVGAGSDFTGLDLLLLDNFFKLQELTTAVGESGLVKASQKWYTFTKDSNSLFTNLLKLCCFAKNDEMSIDSKVLSLLADLVSQSLLFHDYKNPSNQVLVHQISVIASSLKLAASISNSKEELGSIWKLLDQTMSRSVSPYKYIDLSNSKYSKVSPFLVVLFEQFQYVEKQNYYELALFWLTVCAKYMCIIGEPVEGIIALLKDYVFANDEEKKKFEDIESFIVSDFNEGIQNLTSSTFSSLTDAKTINENLDNKLSFFENILNTDVSKLTQVQEVLVTNLDLVGLLNKLDLFLLSGNATNKKLVINKLAVKVQNYLRSTKDNDVFSIIQKFVFKQGNNTEKSEAVLEAVGTIIYELDIESLSIEYASLVESFSRHVNHLLAKAIKSSEALSGFLSNNLWAVDDNSLLDYINDSSSASILASLLLEAYARNLQLSSSQFLHVLQSADSQDGCEGIVVLVNGFVTNRNMAINEEDFEKLIPIVLQNNDFKAFLHYLIKSNELFVKHLISYWNEYNLQNQTKLSYFILSSISHTVSYKLFEEDEAYKSLVSQTFAQNIISLLKQNKLHLSAAETLSLVINIFPCFTQEDRAFLFDWFIAGKNGKDIFTTSALELLSKLLAEDAQYVQAADAYFNKCILFLNKKFSERSAFTDALKSFFISFTKLTEQLEVFKLVSHSLINTQFEIILSKKQWIAETEMLEYILKILINYQIYLKRHKNLKSSGFQHNRFLQMFLNNDKNALLSSSETDSVRKQKFLSSLIVYKLFNLDAAKNSTISVREKILLSYNGTTASFDLILLDILNVIEKHLSQSWLNNYFVVWEFDNGNESEEYEQISNQQRLFTKENNELTVAFNCKFIKDSVNHFVGSSFEIPRDISVNSASDSVADVFSNNSEFFDITESQFPVDSNNKGKKIYDPRFLLLSIINSPEFLSFDKEDPTVPIFDLKKLVDTSVLELLIVCLSSLDESLLAITQTILFNIVESIKKAVSYKDKDLIRILILKVLSSFKSDNDENSLTPADFPPLVYHQLSQFVPIISNPGHFLYENAYKYLLGMPTLSKTDIPMFKLITSASDPGVFHKETIWLLSTLCNGTKTVKDLQCLKKRNVIDWALALQTSPYLHYRIEGLVNQFLSKVTDIAAGADTLITKYGVLSALEMRSVEAEKAVESGAGKAGANVQQKLLDIKALNVKNALIIQENKRLRDWTKDSAQGWVKRVCL